MFAVARTRIATYAYLASYFQYRVQCTMPKDRSYIPGLQKNRLKIREKTSNNTYGGASQCYLQFVGSGAKGAPKSLYLFTDKNRYNLLKYSFRWRKNYLFKLQLYRYIFNVGEGTQRLAHEHKVKITRLEHVFITYPIWENIGGLPGMSLTLQECGVPDLTLHGPSGVVKNLIT